MAELGSFVTYLFALVPIGVLAVFAYILFRTRYRDRVYVEPYNRAYLILQGALRV